MSQSLLIAPVAEALTFARTDAGRIIGVTAYENGRIAGVDLTALVLTPGEDAIDLVNRLGRDALGAARGRPATASRSGIPARWCVRARRRSPPRACARGRCRRPSPRTSPPGGLRPGVAPLRDRIVPPLCGDARGSRRTRPRHPCRARVCGAPRRASRRSSRRRARHR